MIPVPDDCSIDLLKNDLLNLELDKRETIIIEQEDEIFHLKRQLRRLEAENQNLRSENNILKEDADLSFQLKMYYKGLIVKDNVVDETRQDLHHGINQHDTNDEELRGRKIILAVPSEEISQRGRDDNLLHSLVPVPNLEIDKRETIIIEQEDEFHLKRQLTLLEAEIQNLTWK